MDIIYFIILLILIIGILSIPVSEGLHISYQKRKYGVESFSNPNSVRDFGSDYDRPTCGGQFPYAKQSYPIYYMDRCLYDHPQGCDVFDSLIYARCAPGFKEVYGYSCFPDCSNTKEQNAPKNVPNKQSPLNIPLNPPSTATQTANMVVAANKQAMATQ